MFFLAKDCRCGGGKKYGFELDGKNYCEDCKPEGAERWGKDITITFTESGKPGGLKRKILDRGETVETLEQALRDYDKTFSF